MSDSTASAIPGYWTFTATSAPSLLRPRWTWPILAAAAGLGSISARTCSGSEPHSSARTPRISFQPTAGTLSRSEASRCCRYSAWSGSRPGNSIVESTWPAFIAAPRMTAS